MFPAPRRVIGSWFARGNISRASRRPRIVTPLRAHVPAVGPEPLEARRLMAISAVADTIVVARSDVELTMDVLANDREVPAAGVITSTSQAGHGVVQVLRVPGQRDRITYRPSTGSTGADTFSYSVADGAGGTSSAVVSISTLAPASAIGIVGEGRDHTYALADGYSVSPDTPFRPRARGNYSFTDVREVTRQTASTSAGVTQATDVQTLDHVVVTSTETASGAWTYAESVTSSRYAATASDGEVGTFGDVSGSYTHTFTSSGTTTDSSYTFTASGESVGSGTIFDRWTKSDGSSGDNSQFFLTVDTYSIGVISSGNLVSGVASGTLTGHGEGGTLIAGGGSYAYPTTSGRMTGQFDAEYRRFYSYDRDATTYSLAVTTLQDSAYRGTGTALVTFAGGSMSGTRLESGSTHRRGVATTVSSRDAQGGWSTTGTATFHDGASSSNGYDDSGTYSLRAGDSTSGSSISGTLARDGGRTSTYAYDWTEQLDPSGSTRIISGTGGTSLIGGDRWSQSGQGEFWLPTGNFRGTLNQSSSDTTTLDYTTSATITNGRWVTTGSGGGTSQSQQDSSTDGSGTYASNTVSADSSWSVSGTLQKSTIDSKSVDANWSETLGAAGQWALASGTSRTTTVIGSQTSNDGLGAYTYTSAGTAVSGTFTELGDTSDATVITVDSTFADGAWGTTGSGASRRVSGGIRGSTGHGTYTGSGSSPLVGETAESALDAWDDESFYAVGLVNGEWKLARGGVSRAGSGTNTASYDIAGGYASDSSGVAITGVRRNANTETTIRRYLVSSQSTGGDWTTTGSASTMVTGNGTRGHEGRGIYQAAGADGGLAWTNGGEVGEASIVSTIYTRNWNELLGPDGSWTLTAGTGMSRDTGHDASSLRGGGTYQSQSPSANPFISGTTTESAGQGSDWTFTVSSAVSGGAWVDMGFGSGTAFDSSDTSYRGTTAATAQGTGWTQTWDGKHSGGTGSRTDDTWHQTLLSNGTLQTSAAMSTLKQYSNDSSSYESTGTYSVVNGTMSIGGTTSESGSSGTSTNSTIRSELVNGTWVTTSGDGTSATWDGGKGNSTGSGNYSYKVEGGSVDGTIKVEGGSVDGTIDENGNWRWGSRYDTFSDIVDGAWITNGFGGDESSTASNFTANGNGGFVITLPGTGLGSDGTGIATGQLVIDGKIKESSAETFSRDEAAAFVFATPDSGVSQSWQQVGGQVKVKGNSSVTWDAWKDPPPAGATGSTVSFRTGQKSKLEYDLWSNFDGDGWADGGTSTIKNDFSDNVTIRRQGTYAIAGLKGALITGDVTSTAGTDRKSSYEVVRRLGSDGVWRVTSGMGSSHQEESASTKYDDGTGSLASPSWDTATETLKNSKALTKRVWFDTNSTIDTATGKWKTTGNGGSESSGVIEITFSGEHDYQKDLPVATAMKVVTSGTYSQTMTAKRDYDFSTTSVLEASGAVTTEGKGTASRTDTTHTWWNAGDKDTKLTAPNGATVTHTEHGDRKETTTVATDWVFAGGGWREESTNLTTNNASNGGFASTYNELWEITFDPVRDGREGSGGGGHLIKSASGSHDYTSSSDLTRTALAGGGFKVTGSREGGGQSHGTSSFDYHDQDFEGLALSSDLDANDSFDYTGDHWTITFGDTGMPSITYSGTLTTSESFSTQTNVNRGYVGLGLDRTYRHAFAKEDSRTRSANTDEGPAFAVSGGRGLFGISGYYDTSFPSFWGGYGNSHDVARAGYGYDESRTVPGAFGGGLGPEAATPPETPSGASTVPKDINSEATNYEARLAGLTSPRLVTSGSRPLGSGSANLPAMPKISTPAIGDLGFEKSDSAPEAPTTRPFNDIVVSGMAGPVGAMASPLTGSGSGAGSAVAAFASWFSSDAAQVYANTEGMSPLWRGYTVAGFAVADMVGVRQLSDAFSTHDAADGHVQSWGERVSDGAFGAIGLAGTTAVVGRAAIAAANKVDDVGRCMNALTRINLGACFTGDTLVQVTALAGEPSQESAADGSVATATLQTVAIAMLPLGARVLAGNPRPEEMDDSFAEPEQATWVTVSVRMTKRDGTVVRAEFLRPRGWVARHGIVAGAALPMAIAELEVEGDAVVTAIGPCPQIATGDGRVVTGRFLTREAGNLVRVALENGTEIRATDVHPVWSVDREEWVPAGELEPGEQVDTLTGPVAVREVQPLESALDVYNIEVHGEHVFRVTADGVLVHNACAWTSGNNAFAAAGIKAHEAYKAGLADKIKTFKEFTIPGTRRRIDFIDFSTATVYELKPNNDRALRRGATQAATYIETLRLKMPEYAHLPWKYVIDTY
jgi:hypothetical protein